MPKKNLHLVSYKMLNFTSFLKSKLICIIFWGVACLLAYEDLQGNYFLSFSPLMLEILHVWRDFFHWCGRFYMLAGRAGEIVSRRETPSQCGRVGSPGVPRQIIGEIYTQIIYRGGTRMSRGYHVIRVIFQDQALYARTSFRGTKTCKIGKKGVFFVI